MFCLYMCVFVCALIVSERVCLFVCLSVCLCVCLVECLCFVFVCMCSCGSLCVRVCGCAIALRPAQAYPGSGGRLQFWRRRFQSCFASAFFGSRAAVHYRINQGLANASCVCAVAQLRLNLPCAIIPMAWGRLQVWSHVSRRRFLRRVLPCTSR